jgi:hypothetical protein
VRAARRVPPIFASSLGLALNVPVSLAADAPHDSSDVLLFAAIALVLFVFGGLMVVRTTAQVLRRERPV